MATSTIRDGREGYLRVPRSRGALSGLLLVALGVWGGLMPFLGPVFNYAYSPNVAWTWTTPRFWLEVLPAIAAIVGGLLLGASANRPVGLLGGYLAAAAGAWFVLGPIFGPWVNGTSLSPGTPVGLGGHMVIEQIGLFYGLGVAILFLAAHALGRLTVRSAIGGPAEHRAAMGRGDMGQPGVEPYPADAERRDSPLHENAATHRAPRT